MHCFELSENLDIYQCCTLTKRQAEPLYSRMCRYTHKNNPLAPPSLAHWIGLIQTYQHAWQRQLWLNLRSATDGLRWAKVVSLSPFTQRSKPVCHTSGQHMLWETAAPPLSCLFVCLGFKPPRNDQFRPLEGVCVCLSVTGWVGGGVLWLEFPYTGGFSPSLDHS